MTGNMMYGIWDMGYGIWEFFDTLDNDEFNVLVRLSRKKLRSNARAHN